MTDAHILAIDLAKRSFQICAASPGGAVLFSRTASRAKLERHLCSAAAGHGGQPAPEISR